MSRLKIPPFMLGLMLLGLSCLTSCATTSYNYCPAWPMAGAAVADEIEQIDGQAFWEWLARLNKLRLQLELCSLND